MTWEDKQRNTGEFENKIQGTSEYESRDRTNHPNYRITEDGEERVLESGGLRLMEYGFLPAFAEIESVSGEFENKLSGQSNWENKTI